MDDKTRPQICGGKTDSIGDFPCDNCMGTGRKITPGVGGINIFFPCNGKGRRVQIRWTICNKCGGTGYN